MRAVLNWFYMKSPFISLLIGFLVFFQQEAKTSFFKISKDCCIVCVVKHINFLEDITASY